MVWRKDSGVRRRWRSPAGLAVGAASPPPPPSAAAPGPAHPPSGQPLVMLPGLATAAALLFVLLLRTLARANLSLTITFLYPAYASYKALQSRPRRSPGTSGAATAAAGALSGLSGSDEQVERWLMYWAVVGVWAGVEGCVGWVLAW